MQEQDKIIWVFDRDDNQFLPLINGEGCFEFKPNIKIHFFNLQNRKMEETHDDLIDELNKKFEEDNAD